MAEERRVVVTGATGTIGRRLYRRLRELGYDVVVFSRNPRKARKLLPKASGHIAWKPAENGPWAKALDGAYAVVNLAGASIIGQRWDSSYKKILRDSRIIGTRGLVNAIEQAQNRPKVLVSGSAVGYYGYGDTSDRKLDESDPPDEDFLARLCVDWEAEAARAETLGVRTVIIRTGIVLDDMEGPVSRLKLPFFFFMGGPMMPGNQYMSWVHLDDEVNIIVKAIEDERMRGAFNATAPEPVTQNQFSADLARALRRPSWLSIPVWLLRFSMGDAAESLIRGRRILPTRLQEMGYQFQYPTLYEAIKDVLKPRK